MNHIINYSIIIPHKNIPKLLQRCLDSIPHRDDVQIIIVDDNSDPDIVDFENFPGLGAPHIEVIFTKEEKGAGFARNTGITKAAGKWLLFSDADDFFNYCINDIFEEYVNSEADIVYFKHNSLDSCTYTAKKRCSWFNIYIDYWQHSSKKADALLRYKHMSPWAKLLKKEFIDRNRISFDEVPMSNDVTFSYLSGYYANSIYADPRALYCTTIREGSIRQSKITNEKRLSRFYVGAKRYLFFREHSIPVSNGISFINYLIRTYFFDRNNLKKAKDTLFDLGFTPSEVFRLFLFDIIIFFPRQIKSKLFPNNSTFLPLLYMKFIKLKHNNK
jgi:glycosyltransferase involved in cell wall biosynthesis